MKRALLACSTRSRAMLAALRPYAPEILLAATVIAGWSLVTLGLARLAPARVVWPFSLGLLLLSLAGWGFLKDLAKEGLYILADDRRASREQRRAAKSPAPRRVA